MKREDRLPRKRVDFRSMAARVEKMLLLLMGKYINNSVGEVQPPDGKSIMITERTHNRFIQQTTLAPWQRVQLRDAQ